MSTNPQFKNYSNFMTIDFLQNPQILFNYQNPIKNPFNNPKTICINLQFLIHMSQPMILMKDISLYFDTI